MNSVEKVENYLDKFGLKDKIITFKESSATVEMAAKAAGTAPERIAKTLSFVLKDKYIVIVVAGDKKIDNSKYKGEFHEKACMVPYDDVLPKIGHPVGGVCPFAVNEGVEVYLDVSLKEYETVFPACGATNNAIEITPDKLEEITNMVKWVDVCKDII